MDNPLNQSKLTEYGFPEQEGRVRRNKRPIKSICVSCGEERWLNWIVVKDYVCDECVRNSKSKQKR